MKYEYHNFLTGKLSDFAGLFAFPFFFACFFPRRIKLIYWATAILFVIWNSSAIQPLLDAANALGIPITRTVDFTDNIALSILPISYNYWNSLEVKKLRSFRLRKSVVVGLSLFAFIATSMPRYSEEYNYDSDYEITVKERVSEVKEKLNLYSSSDSINGLSFWINSQQRAGGILTKINLRALARDSVTIELDSVHSFMVLGRGSCFRTSYDEETLRYYKGLSLVDIEDLFEQRIKEELKLEE